MERMYLIIGYLQALSEFTNDAVICNTLTDDKIGLVVECSRQLLDDLMNRLGELEEKMMPK